MSSAGCDCMAELRMSGDLAELDRFCKRPKSHTVASPHPASYSEFQATNSGSAMPDAPVAQVFHIMGDTYQDEDQNGHFSRLRSPRMCASIFAY